MKLLIGLSILGNVILAVKLMRLSNKYNQEIEECNEELYDQGKEIDDLQFQLTEKERELEISDKLQGLYKKDVIETNKENVQLYGNIAALKGANERSIELIEHKNKIISKLEEEKEKFESKLSRHKGCVKEKDDQISFLLKENQLKDEKIAEVIESRDNYKGYMNFILNSPRDIRRKFAKGENIPYVVDGEVKMLVVKEGE